MEAVSLYIHIPFCQYRCSYCDFNTYTSLSDLKPAYTDALVREIAEVAAGRNLIAQTIFFGGGTPSLMPPHLLKKIFEQIHRSFTLMPEAEVTMEANPETVDKDYLTAVQELGVNRISFGAQSAVASELAILGREHTFETVRTAVSTAQAIGLTNLNIDLIYGVPGQTLESWRSSLEAAVALATPHLSLYCLTIEPGTPMQRWLHGGEIEPPDPDLAADQYEFTCEFLERHGFEHYEISNWAKPGFSSRHNLAYWYNENYLGFGAGAHGHAAGTRYAGVRQPRAYIRRLTDNEHSPLDYPLSAATADHTRLSTAEQMSDTVIMGLRLLQEGATDKRFRERFNTSLPEAFGETLSQLYEMGLLAWSDQQQALKLTRKGWFLSNQVFRHFV
ncbi:MAG: radical SAM family heme chaperone HemW [Ardenticatenaceae bacterium]|nr:radical SAM family heme chaperone HemW [Ardenticatenaceae bacterium]